MKKFIYILVFFLISCEKENSIEENNNVEIKYLNINSETLSPSSISTTITVRISTNTNWVIKETPNWLSTNISSGNSDSDLILSISENQENNPRTGVININYDNKIKSITITQEKKIISLELISYSGLDDNINFFEPAYLLFNKPINFKTIKSASENWSIQTITENDVEYFNENHGIRFRHPSTVGKSFLYRYQVEDLEGQSVSDTVRINNFYQKIKLESSIRNMILDDDDDIWLLTTSIEGINTDFPSYLYKLVKNEDKYKIELKVRTDNEEIERERVEHFDINPYNQLIYVPNSTNINVFTKQGELVKSIDDTSLNIKFTSNGKGLLSNHRPYRIIDSSKDDLITKLDLDSNNPVKYKFFGRFYRNFDKTKIYMSEIVVSGGTPLYVYDGRNDSLQPLSKIFGEPIRGKRIAQNKLNNKMYIMGLYTQRIVTEDGSYKSFETYAQSSIGDFAYNFGENLIFRIDANGTYLSLDNYGNQETIFALPLDYKYNWTYYTDLKTTKDGKYIITYSSAENEVIIYTTDMFIKN